MCSRKIVSDRVYVSARVALLIDDKYRCHIFRERYSIIARHIRILCRAIIITKGLNNQGSGAFSRVEIDRRFKPATGACMRAAKAIGVAYGETVYLVV